MSFSTQVSAWMDTNPEELNCLFGNTVAFRDRGFFTPDNQGQYQRPDYGRGSGNSSTDQPELSSITVEPKYPDILDKEEASEVESCRCCDSSDEGKQKLRDQLEDVDKPITKMKLVVDENEHRGGK